MASSSATRHILVTGPPGIGKTTLIRKLYEAVKSRGISPSGFYTEEVRSDGRRIGFDVVTLDGQRGTLARVGQESDLPKCREFRVGQYSVNLQSFEQIALPALRVESTTDSNNKIYVIDEIGKMELFSESFKQAVKKIFSQPNITVLATVPIAKGKPIPFVEEIRRRTDAKLFTVSRENRNEMLDKILAALP